MWPLDPYSASYWPKTKPEIVANITRSPTKMAPPRIPLNPILVGNNILLSSLPQLGVNIKSQDALSIPVKPDAAKPRNSVPSKPIPSDLLEDFKKAISGSDLTKAGLIEVLKKK